MRLENIYLHEESIESFISAIKYDPQALTKIAKTLSDYFLSKGKSSIKILDIGIGTGSFTIPIIEYFEKAQKLNYVLECFDVSEHMIQRANSALIKAGIPPNKARCLQQDAEEGLINSFDLKHFDLIIATFVLDSIDNWEDLLDDMADCLKDDGLLVQAEIIGDLRNVDGKFDTNSPPLFESFWERYFTERAKYSNWTPDISVSDLSQAYAYLKKKNGFKVYKEESFLWEVCFRWSDLCDWITTGPLPSLASGIGLVTREYLARVMHNWLKDKRINEITKISLKWGFKITWMQAS